jgi:hypothetical protein
MRSLVSCLGHCPIMLVLLGLPSFGGCSYLAVTPAPEPYAELKQIDCTTENYAPALDVLSAIATAGGAVTAGIAAGVAKEVSPALIGTAVGGAVLAIIEGVSADYGYRSTAHCRAARDGIPETVAERAEAPSHAVSNNEVSGAAEQVPGRCSADVECPSGASCVEGQCRAGEEPDCRDDTQCLASYACVEGHCVERPVTPTAPSASESAAPADAAPTP